MQSSGSKKFNIPPLDLRPAQEIVDAELNWELPYKVAPKEAGDCSDSESECSFPDSPAISWVQSTPRTPELVPRRGLAFPSVITHVPGATLLLLKPVAKLKCPKIVSRLFFTPA